MRETIFLSYSWAETKLADKIEKAFGPTGLKIIRDIRELSYKDSIMEYMKRIRSTDYALLIISDNFLKSSNAMYEVLELFKDIKIREKILPIIVDGTRIYKTEDQFEYLSYWEEEYKNFENKIKLHSPTNVIDSLKKLKHYENIKNTIIEFLSMLTEMNLPVYSSHEKENFKSIFDYLNVSDQLLINEILSLPESGTDEEIDIEIHKLEKKYPNNSKIYFVKGQYAYERNQIDLSIYYYKESIELDPTYNVTYYNLGYNFDNFKKDFKEARKLYEKAIELDTNNTNAYINLARIYSKEFNNPEKARELLERVLEKNPYEATAHFNLALIFHRDFKEFEQAETHYEWAIRIEKDFIDAKRNYGLLLWKKLSRYNDAKKQFFEILEFQPENKYALWNLKELLTNEYKHFSSAKIYYDKFIKIEPNSASDHNKYATFLMLHFLSSDKDLARKHYDIACSMDSKFKSDELDLLLG